MAQNSDDLVVKIKADIKDLQRGLRQAAKEADIAGKHMEKSLSPTMDRIKTALAAGGKAAVIGLAGIGTAAVGAASSLGVLLGSALDTADGLAKMADKTGFSVEEIQRLRYAANQAGVEQEALDASMSKFVRTLGLALAGTPDAVKEFEALGFSLDRLKTMTPDEVFLELIRKMEKLPDAAKRAAMGAGVFGKASVEMGTLASQGAGALDAQREKAEKLGIVLSNDLVRGGDAAGDALETLRRVIKTGLEKALLTAAPQITAFIEELLADPEALQARIASFIEAAAAIAKVAGAAMNGVKHVVDFAKELGIVVAEMVHGSDVPFEEEIQKVQQALQGTGAEIKAINDLGFLGNKAALPEKQKQFEELTKKLHELTQAQQDWLNTSQKAAEVKPPPIPEPPKGGGGEEEDFQSAAAKKAAEQEAKRQAEEIKREHEKNQAIIASARERIATEAELENSRYELTRSSLEKIAEAEFGSAEQKNEMLRALQQDHIARMGAIDDKLLEEQADKDKADFELMEARKESLKEFQIAVADSAAAQVLAEQQAYDERIKQLEEYSEYELASIGGKNKLKEDIERQHQSNMQQLAEDALQSNLNFLTWIENEKLRKSADSFAALIQIGGKNNKKLFKLSQAIALANAAATLPSAVIKSYEAAGGYPFGIPAALAMAATGAAQIAAIKNANYGGGASASVPGASAAGGGVVGDTNARPTPQISVSLVGGNFSGEQVRGLIDQINEALKDGASLG